MVQIVLWGSLNHLTKELVLKAAKEEIQSGERCWPEVRVWHCLLEIHTDRYTASLPLDLFDPPLLGRAGFEQKIINKSPLVVNDDVVCVTRRKLQYADRA